MLIYYLVLADFLVCYCCVLYAFSSSHAVQFVVCEVALRPCLSDLPLRGATD